MARTRPAQRAAARLSLGAPLAAAMVERLPGLARAVVAAVIAEVPAYSTALSNRVRTKIEVAVQVALRGFIELAAQADDAGGPLAPVVDASYDLGRGEARAGRSMDALLSAYRVGARVTWRELGAVAVAHGLGADQTARLAELVFAYIDELSAAGAAGHAAELDAVGRLRERLLEHLARDLLRESAPEELAAAAARAEWMPPEQLLTVLVPVPHLRRAVATLAVPLLQTADAPGLREDERLVTLLVPVTSRAAVLTGLRELPVVVGPARAWGDVAASYGRALRAYRLSAPETFVDTEQCLAELVLTADGTALADLRTQALAPLDALRPAARDKLVATLRSYLLNHGRRDAMAAELFVHPQTVRYRMGQLRELFGSALEDPAHVLRLTLAVGGTVGA